MHLKAYRIKNFRRLKNVVVDLEHDVSIFVGANNSGKTSATQIIKRLLDGDRTTFSFFDFNCERWQDFDKIERGEDVPWPSISVDLWFEVSGRDLHRVLALLPSLKWRGTAVGLRVDFSPIDGEALLHRYKQAKDAVAAHIVRDGGGATTYSPWPTTLREYLKRKIKEEYKFRHYVLDQSKFDAQWQEKEADAAEELALDSETTSGRSILSQLVRVDYLSAQRHLGDNSPSSASHSRAEELSRCFNRFYERHLEQRDEDHGALQALAASENALSSHFTKVFQSTLHKLGRLGYPGFANPRLEIRSSLRPERLMSEQHATVHYRLDDGTAVDGLMLPDAYNGLGFKNLIYMVVELLDLHESWLRPKDTGEQRPPLHLIFIEEPEAHMHAQLQQAFVRQVMELLALDGEDKEELHSQVVITTHSPHILYERGFKPIRYFRRSPHSNEEQHSLVFNLSTFAKQGDDKDFLARYLKLTHCDLFFADAAILVEGNVERLLMPSMIEKVSSGLSAAYLSILEVGGAFAHKFAPLIEFLGLTTLVITDIDSVKKKGEAETEEDGTEDTEIEVNEVANGALPEGVQAAPAKVRISAETCQVLEPDAVTSNTVLRDWLPKKSSISDLLAAMPEEKEANNAETGARIRVTFQSAHDLTWNGSTSRVAGRTLEEAFALQNATWTQDPAQRRLGLTIKGGAAMTPDGLATSLYKRVGKRSFSKTDFALGVLAAPDESWDVPYYIAEGLQWLEAAVTPDLLRSRSELNVEKDEADARPIVEVA